jgi:regulator of sigma E protease
MSILVFVFGIVLFIGLVIVHELGHFLVAKRNGVQAEEFGIFFPPAIYKRKTRKGWIFSINILPLGGFVKLKGEHDSDVQKGSFGAASLWAKTKIMIAGILMNLVTGIFLLMILSWLGIPQIIPNQYSITNGSHISNQEVLVTYVLANSPASKIGLKPENQIIALGAPGHPQKVNSISDLQHLAEEFAGKKTEIVYKSNGNLTQKVVRLETKKVVAASLKTKNPKGYLGIAITSLTLRRYNIWSGPIEAVGLTWQVISLTFIGLGHALVGLGKLIAGLVTANTVARQHGQAIASSQVAGPVGIYFILKDGSALGYQYMLLIIAVISLTLAIMNILPIPALDGGRLWLMLISRSIGKPLTARSEEIINAIGMFVLITLITLITLVDIHRFF